jgi:hypothetical protein
VSKYSVIARDGHPSPNATTAHGLRGACGVEVIARSYGPGVHEVVEVSRRFGRDHEAWRWGRAVVSADGTVELIRYED